MNLKHIIFGERSLTKVAAVFDSRGKAQTAVMHLRQAAGMEESQVQLVGPDDTAGVVDAPLSRKLEPEQSGIWHTLIRTHVVTGSIGAIAGGLLSLGRMLRTRRVGRVRRRRDEIGRASCRERVCT